MLIQPTNFNSATYSSNKISFKANDVPVDLNIIRNNMAKILETTEEDTIKVKGPEYNKAVKMINFYKIRAYLLAAVALLGLASGYLVRSLIIKGEKNKIENLSEQIDAKKEQVRVLDSTIMSNNSLINEQEAKFTELDSTFRAVNNLMDVEKGRIYVINDDKLGELVLTEKGMEQYAAITVGQPNVEYLKKQWAEYSLLSREAMANKLAHEITRLENINYKQLLNILKAQGEIPEKIFNDAMNAE